MKLIRRAFALTAATAVAALITLAASACGGATTATSTTTNGLENKSPADVLQQAAAALTGAKSVHVVGASPEGHVDLRVQEGSTTGTVILAGAPVKITIIGGDAYIKTTQAGLKALNAPLSVQRHAAGRWLKVPASDITGFSLTDLADNLTAYRNPLEPEVRQATLDSRNVVLISWQGDGKLWVANTGPAYPLRAEWKKGQETGVLSYTEYGAPLHVTAPSNALTLSDAR